MNHLTDNLEQVREEAQSMLKTLAAVKGAAYARHVQILLLLRQSSEICGFICEGASQVNPEMTKACAASLSLAFEGIADSLRKASGISKEDWSSALEDAVRIGGSVDGLIKLAVVSYNNGSGFGGAND